MITREVRPDDHLHLEVELVWDIFRPPEEAILCLDGVKRDQSDVFLATVVAAALGFVCISHSGLYRTGSSSRWIRVMWRGM